jgi:hypothetical protein
MGGYGSTRWGGHIKKTTVEDCLTLSMGVVGQFEGLQKRTPWGGTIRWTKVRTGEEVATIGYRFWPRGEEARWDGRLRLQYTITRERFGKDDEVRELDYTVNLETTPCNFGGERWWFRCPLVKSGEPCERRCFKLHSPPGGDYFGCRECYDLTYKSAQEAHEFDSLYQSIADRMDVPMGVVKDLLGRPPTWGS